MGGRKKKEIIVSAPYIPMEVPDEKSVKAQTLEEERIGTLEVARKVGRVFSGLTIGAGVTLLYFSVYLTLTGPLTSSPEMNLLFIAVLAFMGLVNTVSGLLLMGRR